MCLLSNIYKNKRNTLEILTELKTPVIELGTCILVAFLCCCPSKIPLLLSHVLTETSAAFFYYLGYNWTTHRLLTVQAGSLTVPRKFFDRGKSAPLVSVIIIKES